MIRKNILKAFTLGLCISGLIAVTANTGSAYANEQLGGGEAPSYQGTISPEDSALYDKHKEIDLYLFADQIEEIEKLNFDIIYTGVSDTYVEIGITPYNDENADYLYDIFGNELVRVVDTEEVILYTSQEEDQDIAPDLFTSPIMDMGEDAPVSDIDTDEDLIKEREAIADDNDELHIQIESIDESIETNAATSELIKQTGIVEDLPLDDNADYSEEAESLLKATTADTVQITSAKDIEGEDKGLPTASVVAIVVGGLAIIGGTVFTLTKKKTDGSR